MKFLFPLLTLVVSLTSSHLTAQWVRQYPLDKLEDVHDIDVSTDGHGFAVGNNDVLLRLDAASKTWELLPGYGAGWHFEAVDYLDGSGGNIAVAGGTGGMIMTTDGGVNWSAIPGAPADVNTIKFYSMSHIIAIAEADAYVWKNNIWTALLVPAPEALRGAFIFDSLRIWVHTSTNPAIYYTTNGGASWNTNLNLNDIDVVRFFDPLNGIATDGRDVYQTTNGGVNWMLTGDNALPTSVNDIAYGTSANILMAATLNAEPALSIDGGATWTELDPGFINQRSFSIAALSDDEFWIGNDLTSIIHTENRGSNWMETSGPERNIIQDIYFLSRSVGFATGQKGMLLRTNDGGNNWEDISFGTRSHFSIYGLNVHDLWIGANQRILHSVDTGSTWAESLIIVGGNINDVLALTPQRILAGSSAGIIYLSTNGGVKWDTVYNAGVQIRSIAKIADQRLMATGFNGVILRSEDNGATWLPLAVPEAALQYEQAFFLGDKGWLVTSSFKKTMWSTTNAGDSWTPITLPVDRFWDGVYFITPDTGIIVGRTNNEGRAYITYTGGHTWSSGYVTSFPLFGVAGVPNPNGTAWIYGFGSDIEILPNCNTFPAIANFMGNLSPCENDTVTYSVSSENVDQFTWIFPSGWQIVSDPNNDTVQVEVGATSGFISINGTNVCGQSGQLNFSAGSTLLPVLFSIGGNQFPCVGDIVAYTVFENNVNDFVWSFPVDWSIQGNANQPTVMVQVGSLSGNISVSGSNVCGSGNATLIVSPDPLPTVTLLSGDLTPCPGDTVHYVFSGTAGISFNFTILEGLDDWIFLNGPTLHVIAGHDPGSLQIVAENICGSSAQFILELTPEFVPEVDIIGDTATLSFHPSVTGIAYQWFLNGQPIAGATGFNFTPVVSGEYHVLVTFPNGCTALSFGIDVVISGIFNPPSVSNLKIYPVPASEKLYFNDITGPFTYQIIDLAGRIIDKGSLEESIIPVVHLDKGYYLLNIVHDNTTYISNFVKA